MLLINGLPQRVGRFPNYVGTSNKGFLYYENSVSNTSISDNKMIGLNFTGGDVVIRKSRWVIDRSKITLHAGNTINYTSQSGYWPDKGNGYFIQNHINTLDEEGEWFYEPDAKRIGIFTTGGRSALADIQVSTVEVLISITNQSNIALDNIAFTGANTEAFSAKSCSNIKISNCDFLFSGKDALNAEQVDFLTIEKCTIINTNNIAFKGNSCTNLSFKNNIVRHTGVFAGMGDGDSGSYEALIVSGDNILLEQNQIDSTGYIP